MASSTSSSVPDGLEVEVGITLNKLVRQMAAAEARMRKTANKMQEDFDGANKNVTQGFQKSQKAAMGFANNNQMRFALRNLGEQLSQVGQQGAATGNYFGAMLMQLPDMAIGFGSAGIAISVLASALPALIHALGGGDAEAKKFAATLKELKTVSTEYDQAVKNEQMTLRELAARYGDNAGAMHQLYIEQKKIAELKFNNTLADTAAGLQAQFKGLSDVLDRIDTISKGTRASNKDASIEALKVQLQTLSANFKINVVAATKLNDALTELKNADGAQQQGDAAMHIAEAFNLARDSAGRLPPELAKAQDDAITLAEQAYALSGSMGDAARNAKLLKDENLALGLDAAANAAERMAAMILRARVAAGEIPAVALGHDKGAPTHLTLPPVIMPPDPKGTAGHHKLTESEKAYKKVIKEATGNLHEYQLELKAVAKARDAGAISAEQAAQEEARLKQRILESTDAGKYYVQTMQSFESSMSQAIVSGQNLSSVLANLASKLAEAYAQAALFGTGPFSSGGTAGKPNGGMLSGMMSGLGHLLGIPGYAGGTSYAPGGAAIVGESGPELINLPRGSQVIPSGQTRQMMSGGSPQAMQLHVHVSGARGNAEIEQMVMRGVSAGLSHYDSYVVPLTIRRVSQNPDIVGG